MSHTHLRNAVIAGNWPTRTTTRAIARTSWKRDGASTEGGGVLAGRGGMVGMVTVNRRCGGPARACATPMSLLQPIIPCCGMATCSAATCSMATGDSRKVLTEDNVFINLRKMEYAVRGPLLLRALEIEKELQKVR